MPHTDAYLVMIVLTIAIAIFWRRNIVRIICLLAFTGFITAFSASITKNRFTATVAQLPAQPTIINGVIEQVGKQNDGTKKALVTVFPHASSTQFRVLLKLQGALATTPLFASQQIIAHVKLTPFDPPLSSALFNAERFGLARRLHASATVNDPKRWWAADNPKLLSFSSLRQMIVDRTLDALAPKEASTLLALMIGDTDLLSNEQTTTYRELGAQHLLAISGLQVTLLSALCFFLFIPLFRVVLGLRYLHHADKFSAGITVVLMFCFIGLSNFSSSAIRAFLMAAIMALPTVITRRIDGFDAFFLSGLLTILIWPTSVLDLGYRLSYAATFGLMLAHARTRTPLKTLGRHSLLLAFMSAALVTSMAAFFATLPLVLAELDTLAPLATISNFILVPIAGVFQAPAIIFGLAGCFFNQSALITFAAFFSNLIEIGAEMLQEFLGFTITVRTLSSPSITFLLIATLLLFFLTKSTARKILPIMALLLVVPAFEIFYPQTDFVATVIPVGQGDATLFFMPPHHHLLLDAGGNANGDFDPGLKIVLPTLQRRGIKELDALVISHPDPDHIAGAFALLDNLHVKEIWHSGFSPTHPLTKKLLQVALTKGIAIKDTRALLGNHRFGRTTVQVLAPHTNSNESYFPELKANDNSLVLRFIHGQFSLLWPGDIEYFGEKLLLSSGAHLKSDIVKAPHHGSKTSSSPEFIAHVAPRHVIYSTGKNNRFTFPHDIVVERYRSIGAKEWDTAKNGEITISINDDKIDIDGFIAPFQEKTREIPLRTNYRMTYERRANLDQQSLCKIQRKPRAGSRTFQKAAHAYPQNFSGSHA